MNANHTSPTRERILKASQQLILSVGFSGMTIDAICNATGLTKGGFFHHFASKDALGEATLDYFWQSVQQRQNTAAYQQLNSDVAKLLGYIDQAIEDYQQPLIKDGCMLAIFTMELSDTNPSLHAKSASYFQQWQTELIAMLTTAASEHDLKNFDAKSWSELLITTIEGGLLLGRAQNDNSVIKRTLSLYKCQLETTLKR